MGDSSKVIKNKTGQQVSMTSSASIEDKFTENEKLFIAVMKNKWEEVVTTYQEYPRAREAKLTSKSEDTALHIAVSNDQTESARKMVDTIDAAVLMKIQNAKENTPLHLAAMRGNLEICKEMVEKEPRLLSVKNKHGETPIFLAVRYGQQEIFSYLRKKSDKKENYLRRKNGDTILHAAIFGEYFGMAGQIIEDHETLVDAMNEDGLTPLHVLANKPNAFKSSTRLGTFDRFIYYCMFVDTEIKERSLIDKSLIEKYRKRWGGGDNDNKNYPKNYETCMNFLKFIHVGVDPYKIIKTIWMGIRKCNHPAHDVENPQQKSSSEQIECVDRSTSSKKVSKKLKDVTEAATSGSTSKSFGQVVDIEIEKEEIFQEEDEDNKNKNGSSKNQPENYDTCKIFIGKLQCLFSRFAKILFRTRDDKKDDNKSGEEKQSVADIEIEKEETSQEEDDGLEEVKMDENRKGLFPPNYDTLVLLTKFMMKLLLIILGLGIRRIREIERRKELHLRAKPVMELLIKHTKLYNYQSYGNTGANISKRDDSAELVPESLSLKMLESEPEAQEATDIDQKKAAEDKEKNRTRRGKEQTPLLLAAKNGVTEMVEKILEEFPVAIQDEDAEQKNVALLAIENRQPHVYKFLLEKDNIPTEIFHHVDYQDNSALHLAATQCEEYLPWLIPGSALQMQWEIKWFKFVQNSMPPNFFQQYNKKKETPNEVFVNTHKVLIKDGSEWLTITSESCSVVAALVATVAFATSATVPGGLDGDKGTPTLQEKPAFNAFAISSLAALCFSVTALVFFLSILTSRYQEKDFALDLPRKLLLGLTSLFASIASMLVSFCAGHIFVLNGQLRYVAYPLYAALCLPITFFAFAQLSLYFDLFLSIFKRVPQRSCEVLSH